MGGTCSSTFGRVAVALCRGEWTTVGVEFIQSVLVDQDHAADPSSVFSHLCTELNFQNC